MDLAGQQPHQRDLAGDERPVPVVEVVEQRVEPLGRVLRPVEAEGQHERQVGFLPAPLARRAGRQAAQQRRRLVRASGHHHDLRQRHGRGGRVATLAGHGAAGEGLRQRRVHQGVAPGRGQQLSGRHVQPRVDAPADDAVARLDRERAGGYGLHQVPQEPAPADGAQCVEQDVGQQRMAEPGVGAARVVDHQQSARLEVLEALPAGDLAQQV
jgi:hypothetical protein